MKNKKCKLIHFVENLRFLRTKEKLTQKELAEKLSVKPKYISNIECGFHDPSIEFIVKVSDYFNKSLDFLIFFDQSNNSEKNLILLIKTLSKEQKSKLTNAINTYLET